MNKRGKVVIVSIVGMIAAIGIIWPFFPRVTPLFAETTIELGENVSEEITDYLSGQEFLLERTQLDVSEVNTLEVGTYTIHSHVWFYDDDFLIHIVDTTAPELKVRTNDIYLEAGKEYSLDTFVVSASDLSGDVDTVLLVNDDRQETITFSELGETTFSVEAKDASGNVSSAEVKVLVDEAPVFVGLHDRHIEVGKEFDARKNIVAIDNLEGIISDRIQVNSANPDVNTLGQYEVTYSVEDSYGLEQEVTATITVCNVDELEQYKQENTLSEEELSLLCDNGYFIYEPLKEDDYDKALELVHPTLIDIGNDKHGWGSGFIYKVTPQHIYFLTAEHVIKKRTKDTNITFFDNAKIVESSNYIRLSKNNELSMFRIDIQDVPLDTLMQLKQIYIDTSIYDKLKAGDKLIAYAAWWTEKKDVIKTGAIKNVTATWDALGYYFENSCIETKLMTKPGMSGTAIVDYKGNLVGVAFGVSYTQSSSYNLRIDDVEKLWERRAELEEQ